MPTAKKVLSFSSGTWITCAWFECQRQGYELYKTVLHDHAPLPGACEWGDHVNFIFCSERHKQYFVHSHRQMGQLPPGFKLAI